jgi:hypothetical protein
MRRLSLIATALLSACVARSPTVTAPPRDVAVANVDGTALQTEPSLPPAMPAPQRTPQMVMGWLIDDHVGLHAVGRAKGMAALANYDEHVLVRIGGGPADFEIVGTERAAKWSTPSPAFDAKAFAPGTLFVAAVTDVRGEVWVHVAVPVADEHEGYDLMAASRRRR